MNNKLNENQKVLAKVKIVKLLQDANKGLTLLEIRKSIEETTDKILKELIKEGVIKKFNHYLHNSNKKFQHPETKKVDTIKGTLVYKYKLIDKED
jgi:DNA-binding Lrp family transcriptional regulator